MRAGRRGVLSAQILLLACVGGVLAAGLALLVDLSKPLVAFAAVGGLLLPLAATLSGNARLFMLWGLGLTAPLELSKVFMARLHMGGEYALRIESADLFIAALTVMTLIEIRACHDMLRIPRAAWCWLALIALGLIDVVAGPWRVVAGLEVIRMTKMLVLFVVLSNFLRTRERVRHLILALVVGVVLQSGFALVQYALGSDFGLTKLGESEIVGESLITGASESRVGGLLGHPNILSGYLAMVLPLCLALLFSRMALAAKGLAVVALLGGLAALIITLSRNGWVAFGGAVMLVLFLSRFNPVIRARYAGMRLLLVALIAIVLVSGSKTIIDRWMLSNPMNVQARWELIGTTWRMVTRKPLLGHGLNSWAWELPRFPDKGRLAIGEESDPRLVPPVHNIYMQKWAEQGTLGLGLLLLMGVFLARCGFRNLKVSDPFLYIASLGALAGALAILVHGLMDWVWYINTIMRLFFILAGIVMAIYYDMYRERAWWKASSGPLGA